MNWSEILKSVLPVIMQSFGLQGLAGFGFDKAIQLSQELIQQIRRILVLFAITLAALMLFLLGMHFFIIRLLDQLDRGEFVLTNSIIFLLIFNAACIGAIVYATQKKTWSQAFDDNKSDNQNSSTQASSSKGPLLTPGGPIESAVSVLILDFVKEREWKRQQWNQTSATNDSNPTNFKKTESANLANKNSDGV